MVNNQVCFPEGIQRSCKSESGRIGNQTRRYLLCRPESGGRFRAGRYPPGADHTEQCGEQAQSDCHMRGHNFAHEQGEASYSYRDQYERLQDRKEFCHSAGTDTDHRQAASQRVCLPYRPGNDEESRRGNLCQPRASYIDSLQILKRVIKF